MNHKMDLNHDAIHVPFQGKGAEFQEFAIPGTIFSSDEVGREDHVKNLLETLVRQNDRVLVPVALPGVPTGNPINWKGLTLYGVQVVQQANKWGGYSVTLPPTATAPVQMFIFDGVDTSANMIFSDTIYNASSIATPTDSECNPLFPIPMRISAGLYVAFATATIANLALLRGSFFTIED